MNKILHFFASILVLLTAFLLWVLPTSVNAAIFMLVGGFCILLEWTMARFGKRVVALDLLAYTDKPFGFLRNKLVEKLAAVDFKYGLREEDSLVVLVKVAEIGVLIGISFGIFLAVMINHKLALLNLVLLIAICLMAKQK